MRLSLFVLLIVPLQLFSRSFRNANKRDHTYRHNFAHHFVQAVVRISCAERAQAKPERRRVKGDDEGKI